MSSGVPASLAVGRFKQLPLRSADVWQGGIVRLPAWVEDPNDPSKPFRPLGAMWVSVRTGRVHLDLAPEGTAASPSLVLDVLLEFAKQETKRGAGRPGRLEVVGADLRDALDTALSGTDTSVVEVDQLPALHAALRSFEEAETGGVVPPGLLESKGITVDRARALAEAAAHFYRAAPWRHLANADLIVVEAPKAPKGMACVSVLGKGGAEFGLGFFESRQAFERLLTMRTPQSLIHAYGVTFCSVEELPFADVDAWEEHSLPLAGPLAYPFPADIRSNGEVTRPSPKDLAFMEGLLRAIAESTEDDFDAGRWHRRVATFDGALELTLSLPGIVEPETASAGRAPAFSPRSAERAVAQVQRLMSERQFESLDEANAALGELQAQGLLDADAPPDAARPLTALEQAQELVYDAEEAVGRRRLVLAKRALAVSADCADAYRLIAVMQSGVDERIEWFEKGVEAGRRAIGDAFESLTGGFWGHLETRPYMRARLGLALELGEKGRAPEAIAHFRELLRLNPGDNQGVRYLLLALLLSEQENRDAAQLLAEYEDDASATWLFGRALNLYREAGDSPDARRALKEAHRANAFVARFLTEPDEIPWSTSPYITLGGEDEGANTAEALFDAFEATEGALDWLAEQTIDRHHGPATRGKGHRGGRSASRRRVKRRRR